MTLDGMKMTELILINVNIVLYLRKKKEMFIEKDEYSDGFVMLLYLNKINDKIIYNNE